MLNDLEAAKRMKFIVIFGPPAVGKMTVGFELAKLTGLKLFHNHLLLEPVVSIFGFGSPQQSRFVPEFRYRIFEEVAKSDLPGLIFTFVWALDLPEDKQFIDKACAIFSSRDADIYFAELFASQDERLKRNETEFRLLNKLSKRDVSSSRKSLLETDGKYRLTSNEDFFYPERHIKIDNTNLSAETTAKRIAEAFRLTGN